MMAKRNRNAFEYSPFQKRTDRLFTAWFAFCGVMGLAFMGGVVWLAVYVVPHVVHMLDRIQ